MTPAGESFEVCQLADGALWPDLRDWTDEPTQLGGWDIEPPAYVSIEVRS